MKVKNLKKHETGQHDFEVEMSQEEAEFLINLAIEYLVDKNMVEFTQEAEDVVTMKILENIPIENMPRA